MVVSILTGLVGIIAASLSCALLLFAHFTGRLRRPAALALAAAVLTVGGALALAGSMDGFVLGHVALPIGVAFMLAAAIDALLTCQAPQASKKATAARGLDQPRVLRPRAAARTSDGTAP